MREGGEGSCIDWEGLGEDVGEGGGEERGELDVRGRLRGREAAEGGGGEQGGGDGVFSGGEDGDDRDALVEDTEEALCIFLVCLQRGEVRWVGWRDSWVDATEVGSG